MKNMKTYTNFPEFKFEVLYVLWNNKDNLDTILTPYLLNILKNW